MKRQIKKPIRMLRTVGITEQDFGPSMTEAQQVKPLELILKHRLQGIPVEEFHGVYSNEDFHDFNKMDFSEIFEYREQLSEQILTMKEDYTRTTKALADLQKAPKPEEKPTEQKP